MTTLTPLQRLQQELAAELTAGTVSSTDASALSTAITEIDSTLQSEASSSDGTLPSPEEMQAKIEELIDQEVEAGTLTSEQGDALKAVFAATFAIAAGATEETTTATDATATSATATTTESTGSTADTDDSSTTTSSSTSSSEAELEQLIAYFLKLVQQSKAQTSGYDASGQGTATGSSVLLDTRT
jgi:hypothetical protein